MSGYQVPHHGVGLLLAGAVSASASLAWFAPLWLQLLLPVVVVWRLLIQRRRLPAPGRWLRAALALVALAGTLASHRTVLGPEAGTTLLLAAFAVKLLEMQRQRDAYVVLVMGYFVTAAGFLFAKGLLGAGGALLALVLLTAALVALQRPEPLARARDHLRLSVLMLLQALPLLVVLFVLVPRLGPLWGLPQPESARTGMTDHLAPGDVSQLSQSAALAFRVEFDGPPPPASQQYWRGLTYSQFDGRGWRPGPSRPLRPAGPDSGAPGYHVTMEPSGQSWLYSLDHAASTTSGVRHWDDRRLEYRMPLQDVLRYQVRTTVAAPGALSEGERRHYLALPPHYNPRTEALAQQWSADRTPAQLVALMAAWLREQPFHYSLAPPALGRHSVDEFLFDQRSGYCEHYASAAAVLLRFAGIPTRVVGGYQGSDPSPQGGHLRVRQYHAHAWVEYWDDAQRRWVLFDPTAAVAPDRIEMGAISLQQQPQAALMLQAGARLPGLKALLDSAEHLQYLWQKWVLNYRTEQQEALLQRWFGDLDLRKWALIIGVSGLLVLLPMVLWLRRGAPRPAPLQREAQRLKRRLRRHGVTIADGLPVRQWPAQMPDTAAAARLQRWVAHYEALAYGDDSAVELATLRRLRRRI
ncbi:transglutaminase family protein [Isoalcanivorax beigongshangi]|uniref:TransglutaminaseTgpA domain-containing protein n=1 Tax=Isoalcanivorax beigongshangi TaxID=3238810 RepID=A0ABV4AHA7_9GAMM